MRGVHQRRELHGGVVNGDMEDEQNALIVRDIAVSESGVSAENVKIISAAK